MTKKFSSAVLVCALAALALAAPWSAVAQPRVLDFRLVNDTGFAIVYLYVSPTKSDVWGEDVLGVDILRDEQAVDIEFSREETTCLWDIKIIDEEEDEVVWERFNLCEAVEITLRWENGTPTAIVK